MNGSNGPGGSPGSPPRASPFGRAPLAQQGRDVPKRPSLPSAQQMVEAIEDLELLWQKAVPRSARPVNKGLYERIRRQLLFVHDYVKAHETNPVRGSATTTGERSEPEGGADEDEQEEEAEEAGEAEESPLLLVFRMVRTLSPEEWQQLQVLMQMRQFSDVGRAEVFYVLGETHHPDCGMEVDSDEPHDDCPAMIEDEPDPVRDAAEANDPAADASPATLLPISPALPEPP